MTVSSTWRITRLSVLSLLLGSSLVLAQSEATTSAASSAAASSTANSTTASPQTHTVNVAPGGFTFVPDITQAEVGDFIQYNFFPTNHSVARAQYKYPCIPYEDTGVDLVGFFSGFKPVDAILSDPPTFTIRVNDTDPIFFYCTAPGSCINYGMVGVINPNASTFLSEQRELAENSSFMLQPGEAWPSESTPDPFSSGAAAAPTSTSSSATSSATNGAAAASSSAAAAAAANSQHSGLSSGAIAGIAIGAAAVALLAGALLYFCGRQSRRATHQPVPQQYDPHMSYAGAMNPNAAKHMTMASQESGPFGPSPYASPALPGYVPSYDPAMTPPTRPYYVPSDALSPANNNDTLSQRSESPGQMMRGVGVPPYTTMAQPSAQALNDTTAPPQAPNGGPVHEMYAPSQEQQGGFMNLLRSASTRKSGGVERYG